MREAPDLTRLVVPGLLIWPNDTLDKMEILRGHFVNYLLTELVGLFNSDGEKPTLATW